MPATDPRGREGEPPFIYEGAPFHARGLTAAAVYTSSWSPPPDSAWVEHEHVSDCWTHPAYPRHLLSKPNTNIVLISHTSSSTPKMATVLELGALALGAGAIPLRVGMFPLALRLPMRGPGTLVVPDTPVRCARLWPPVGERAHLKTVDGVTVEFRISGTGAPGNVGLYAEAFIGQPHLKGGGLLDDRASPKEPRALLFTADARKVLLLPDVKRFTAWVMDGLLMFAISRGDEGLDVDHRPLPGRLLGRVLLDLDIYKDVPGAADVKFAIRLPHVGGVRKYEGSLFMV
jgi:hypothetical protein